MITIDAPILF